MRITLAHVGEGDLRLVGEEEDLGAFDDRLPLGDGPGGVPRAEMGRQLVEGLGLVGGLLG